MTDQSSRADAWSDYWKSGALHSCVTSLDEAYGGVIGDFWRREMSRIPESARILDIGTGNGPLPKLFAEAGDKSWVIRGIDLAPIRPEWWSAEAHSNVGLIGGCALSEASDKLFQLDGQSTFEILTSQFGWEYIPRPESIIEALKLTATKGRWCFVAHHAGGVLCNVARGEVAHIDLLRKPGGLFTSARAWFPWVERGVRDPAMMNGNAQALTARNAFNAAVDELRIAAEESETPDLLLETLAGIQGLMLRIEAGEVIPHAQVLYAWKASLDHGRVRSAELADDALDADGVEAIFAEIMMHRPSAICVKSELTQAEGLLAWGLTVDF